MHARCMHLALQLERERVPSRVVHRALGHADDMARAASEVTHDERARSRTSGTLTEDGVDLLSEAPRVAAGGTRRTRSRCLWNFGPHKAIDESRLEAELFGIRDVLPGATTAVAKVPALRRHAVR